MTDANYKEISAKLESIPPLARGFAACVQALSQRDDISLAVKGSLVSGTVDRYSDIDLLVVVPENVDFAAARAFVARSVTSLGQVLAHFPATHIGMENLLVTFLALDGWIVKIDVQIMTSREYIPAQHKLAAIHDPRGLLTPPDESKAKAQPGLPAPDFADIHHKFSGWIWYTYTKIARGELLEAADSLDVMRGRALVPGLQLVHGLPYEGYRRMEVRLPGLPLAELLQTFPARIERAELVRALRKLVHLFDALQPQIAALLGKEHRGADLRAIMAMVDQEEQSFARG